MGRYRLIKTEGRARRGEFETPHGTVQTPVFMNVGTQGAIKGALSARDLKEIGCQIELSNTYHLHVRPGNALIKSLGGLHKFMAWDGPILTDSGGFQIFSLASLRKIKEEGVRFNSHVDGRHIFMGPEESMRIQADLGSDIAMAFDECIKIPSPRDYVERSCARTVRWLERCKAALTAYNEEDDAVEPGQMLFGINQGATYHDLRIEHMERIAELDLPGYAIGGLAVGETHQEMYDTIEVVEEYMPADRPRYLM
ncbi:MAG: tRNA guanosine(34) transglycosylase Tgt, partial [Oscillospiraceae bacterium]|nr:tRNA guanosine(34) transglycosylase Tgt [Oscillospiraceae bacterium]